MTPEEVAFKLMEMIFNCEDKPLNFTGAQNMNKKVATRTEILDTYKQCIRAMNISAK